MTGTVRLAAIDLGATSGRVMVAEVGPDRLDVQEAARFANQPVEIGGRLRWDIMSLWRGVLEGLRAAGPVDGIGVDSWAVDFGLLDADGDLIGNPDHYRGVDTVTAQQNMHCAVPPTDLYRITALASQPFNTLYQLIARQGTAQLAAARRLAMIPDLIAYWLTGQLVGEITNASTTGLVDACSRTWACEIIATAGIDATLLPRLVEPGTPIGPLTPRVAEQTGQNQAQLTAVASHDTASAVVAVPSLQAHPAFISCGTWSLVGQELAAPVLSEAAREANFTNELGADGTIRFLRNVMGLWVLTETLRHWQRCGTDHDLGALLTQAEQREPLRTVVDLADPMYFPPGDMPARITAALHATGQPTPLDHVDIVRCIMDSLALAHRRAIRQLQELSGQPIAEIHLVGGGANNACLCQLTADACGLPVHAGPAEATSIGNILIQARTLGAIRGNLSTLRALVQNTHQIATYRPRGTPHRWQAAEARLAAHVSPAPEGALPS